MSKTLTALVIVAALLVIGGGVSTACNYYAGKKCTNSNCTDIPDNNCPAGCTGPCTKSVGIVGATMGVCAGSGTGCWLNCTSLDCYRTYPGTCDRDGTECDCLTNPTDPGTPVPAPIDCH